MNKFPHLNKVLSRFPFQHMALLFTFKAFGFLMLQYLHLYKGSVGSVTPRNSPCATALRPGEVQESANDTPPSLPLCIFIGLL